jgi:predicted O-methyltransferase YrrM
MLLDHKFSEVASQFLVRGTGIENVGPFLYWLVRTTRAQRVLEIVVGYSTLFLLRALLDNADDFEHERAQLAEKTARYHAAADRGRLRTSCPSDP